MISTGIFQGRSAADAISSNNGAGPGFGAFRLILSLLVLGYHSASVAYGGLVGEDFWAQPMIKPVHLFVLPMFFCLSGFLVAGSAERTRSVKVFLTFRILRIVPALLTEVTLSVFIIGSLFTTLALSSYFASPEVWRYFSNILGVVQFHLPGVFESNPASGVVNINLWTLRPEFYCYLLMTILMLSRVLYFPRLFLGLMIAMIVGLMVILPYYDWGLRPNGGGPVKWYLLVICFLLGCLGWVFRDKVFLTTGNLIVALALNIVACQMPQLILLYCLTLAYITIYIGCQRISIWGLENKGDYSYGIYLYGFPIEQVVVALLPVESHSWYMVLLLAFPATLVFSILSWHFVEKPFLRLKRLVLAPKQAFPA
jgi:peptidoglycan/LPS O-acetylase OafA/YrhL